MLYRLQERTGLESLVPLHRIDRDTAGLVLFGIKATSRARYHELFAKKQIQREYLAAARVADVPEKKHWMVENRLGAGTPWFRREILSEGLINASTEIELLKTRDGIGLFRLTPTTGKKHQLRVHMASIGFPILGDALYPEMRDPEPSDPPMQLLASKLTFIDPLTGIQREFNSERRLQHTLSAD
jgi:tRNA pseudouridine32 synthase / 23S rRNA pseudouridine746 synthase